MDTVWTEGLQKLAAKVAGVAPMLGTIIGGPVGGAAGTAVQMIASALGLVVHENEDPVAAINNKIAQDPAALIEIRKLELNNQAELQKLTIGLETIVVQEETKRLAEESKQIESVGLTMREEGKSEHWPQYSWRPAWGFISAAAFLAVCLYVCYLAGLAIATKDVTAITMIPQLIMMFTTLFAIPGAILGVASWKRGQMQVEAVKPGVRNA